MVLVHPQQQQMMQQPHQPMMQHQQPMIQQPVMVMQQSENQETAPVPKIINHDVLIGNAISQPVKIPKLHMMPIIQLLEPQLDGTLTGQFDPDMLAVLFWLLTRMPPQFLLANLQAKHYGQLAEHAKVAAQRVKDRGGEKRNCALLKCGCAADIQ